MEWEEIILDGLKNEENLFGIVKNAAAVAPPEIKNILNLFPRSMNDLSRIDFKDFKSSKQSVILHLLRSQLTLTGGEFFGDSPAEQKDTLESVVETSLEAARLASLLLEKDLEARYLTKAADALYDLRKFSQGVNIYRRALRLYRSLSLIDFSYFSDVAMILNNVGNLYSDMGHLLQAEHAYKESLKIYRELAEKDPAHSEDIAATLNNLGGLYFQAEQVQKAEQACIEALERYRECARKDPVYNQDVAMTLNNLGHLYLKTNQFSLARKVYTEALVLRRALAQKDVTYRSSVAQTLNDLGTLYSDMGNFSRAEEMYAEALKIWKDCAQNNAVHAPDVARTLNDFGILYWKKGKFFQAEGMYREALAIFKDLAEIEPVEYTPDAAMTLNNLGTLYSDMGSFSKAEGMYAEALHMRRYLAENYPDIYTSEVAMTLDSLGSLYSDLGKFSESEKAYSEALQIYRSLAKKNPGVYNPDVARTLSNLGLLYYESGTMKKAEELYVEALNMRRELAKKNSDVYMPEVAQTLNNLGLFYTENKMLKEAEEAYTEALSIKRELAEKDPDVHDPSLALTLHNIGDLYSKMDKIQQAKEKYIESCNIRNKRALWIYLAKTYHALSLLSHGEPEAAIRILELGILFSGEKRYRYAHKGGEEKIYLDLLRKTDDPQRAFGILETLRDSDLLSLGWNVNEIEIEKSIKNTNFQKKLVENFLKKEISPRTPSKIPDESLFLYIQEMENAILYLAVTNRGMCMVKGTSDFVICGGKLVKNLNVQMLGSIFKKDISKIAEKFDTYADMWTTTVPPEIRDVLSEKDTIVLSPDAPCSYFPLEGLLIDQEPICFTKKVIRAASLQQFTEISSQTLSTDSSLIVGNPWPPTNEKSFLYPRPSLIGPLRYLENAEKEAQILAEHLPHSEVLLNSTATAEAFLRKLSHYSIIHFAGHSYLGRILFFSGPMTRFSEFEPKEFSDLRKAWRQANGNTVYLTDEWDIITDIDILNTPLKRGAFVFLSACETGKHKYAGGGYFQGLAQAFIKNGASNVVSSLIPLYDAPASTFAVTFYGNLLSQKSVITALQNTRQKIREKYKFPVYWLPYLHYGSLQDQLQQSSQ